MKIFSIFFIFLLSACSSSNKASHATSATPVEVAEVEIQDVPVFVSSIGNVFGFLTIDVRTQVTGQILEALAQEGDWVKEGQVLFSIDPSLYDAALAKTKGTLAKDQAQLELSKTKVQRNVELVKKAYISPAIFDELKSNVKALEGQVAVDEADVKAAEINVDRTKVYAFSSGKIGHFNFDPGNIVNPTDQMPLATIEYVDKVYVNFTLPEKLFEQIRNLSREKTLEFLVFLNAEKQIGQGKVVFIDNKINAETGTFLLRGLASNPEKLMWPGQFVRIKLIVDNENQATVVPERAVVNSQLGPLVWVVGDDMTVKSLSVVLGAKENHMVVVKSGLTKGQKVVTLGQINLRDGTKVYVPVKEPEKS